MKSNIYFHEIKEGKKVLRKLDCDGHYPQENLAYMVHTEGFKPVDNRVFVVYK